MTHLDNRCECCDDLYGLDDEGLVECPICHETYDDADYDFSICSICGWNVIDKKYMF